MPTSKKANRVMAGEEDRDGVRGEEQECRRKLEVTIYVRQKQCRSSQCVLLRETTHTVDHEKAVILDGNRKRCQNSNTRT